MLSRSGRMARDVILSHLKPVNLAPRGRRSRPARRGRRLDLAVGIALGIVLGVAVISAFVFLGSEDTIDAPRISGADTGNPFQATPTGSALSEEASVPTIVIRNGEPVGGVRELEFSAGDEIRFRVRSDVADEVHVHGYDLSKAVTAGGTVSFSFPADLEGIFEAELEERGTQIAELRVNP